MKSMTEYRTLFYEKIAKTDNVDEAFTKAVWKAFCDGFDAGKSDAQQPMKVSEL